MRSTAMAFWAITLVAWLACSAALAAPMPATGPLTIEGTVEEVAWFPAHSAKAIPGMSGSAGADRQFPARYRVTLWEPSVAGENLARFKGRDRITIWIDHEQDDGFLKAGEKIRVTGYREHGDEGGTWTSFEGVEKLASANPAPEDP